jgi:hypothetical protein
MKIRNFLFHQIDQASAFDLYPPINTFFHNIVQKIPLFEVTIFQHLIGFFKFFHLS